MFGKVMELVCQRLQMKTSFGGDLIWQGSLAVNGIVHQDEVSANQRELKLKKDNN